MSDKPTPPLTESELRTIVACQVDEIKEMEAHHDRYRQQVADELRGLRAELAECYAPEDLAITAFDRAAARLHLDLTT